MRYSIATPAALLLGISTGAFAQSSMSVDAPPPSPPAAKSSQPPQPAADMQAVLTQMMALGAKPIKTLTPLKARLQPSAADAAKAEMHRQGMSTAPDPAVMTQELP